jgi:hypothetical protein
METTGVSIPTGNSKVLLAAVYKSLLAKDLNAKHPFWNSIVSKPSGAKVLNLLHINGFEILAQQCCTHYSPAGNGNMLDIVVYKNVQLSEVIFLTFWT